jgi:hypothetical protein
MGDIEHYLPFINQPEGEIFDPCHFYAAYVFDQAIERERDVQAVLENAQELGYSVRYWWLSDAMDLEGSPDRLIVCVHHPSHSENAGMDLYNALRQKNISWDDLEAAVVEDYCDLGKPVRELAEFRFPIGDALY